MQHECLLDKINGFIVLYVIQVIPVYIHHYEEWAIFLHVYFFLTPKCLHECVCVCVCVCVCCEILTNNARYTLAFVVYPETSEIEFK